MYASYSSSVVSYFGSMRTLWCATYKAEGFAFCKNCLCLQKYLSKSGTFDLVGRRPPCSHWAKVANYWRRIRCVHVFSVHRERNHSTSRHQVGRIIVHIAATEVRPHCIIPNRIYSVFLLGSVFFRYFKIRVGSVRYGIYRTEPDRKKPYWNI